MIDDVQDEHIVISSDAKMRLRLFSAKYKIPMKHIVDWFIYSILDENGDPQIESLREALEEISTLKDLKNKIKESKINP